MTLQRWHWFWWTTTNLRYKFFLQSRSQTRPTLLIDASLLITLFACVNGNVDTIGCVNLSIRVKCRNRFCFPSGNVEQCSVCLNSCWTEWLLSVRPSCVNHTRIAVQTRYQSRTDFCWSSCYQSSWAYTGELYPLCFENNELTWMWHSLHIDPFPYDIVHGVGNYIPTISRFLKQRLLHNSFSFSINVT